jgi:hypothetical protein
VIECRGLEFVGFDPQVGGLFRAYSEGNID